MGYGGFFKTIVRIAVPAIVAMIPGMQPLGIALASAAITGATGGSFQESLMAGATSYIGASISQGLSASSQVGGKGAELAKGLNNGTLRGMSTATGPQIVDVATNQVIATGAEAAAATAAIGVDTLGVGMADKFALGLDYTDQAIKGGISKFTDPLSNLGLGGYVESGKEFLRQPFDVLQALGDTVLKPGALNIIDPLATSSFFSPTAAAIGGATTFTLNQALLANTAEADALLEQQGYTPQQIQLLKQEARNQLAQGSFDKLTGPEGATNPFGTDEAGLEEFKKVIAAGIERENTALGPDITEAQFNTVFDDPFLGQSILGSEEDLRKQSFNQQIGTAFPGNAFTALDDDIINSIVSERQGPAQQQISRFGARGNLNPTGGLTANQFIQRQVPEAQERVKEISAGVLGGGQRDVNVIRERAREQAGGYKLGEDLFDVTPFSEERKGLVEERQGTLGSDVRSAIGSDPLFDVSGALRSAGRAQGVVSGQGQNQSFLDSIAAREGISANRTRRGLGSRGSGAF
jgi:hypothetical protein